MTKSFYFISFFLSFYIGCFAQQVTLANEQMLAGINVPIRIEKATVLPGDVVLAKRTGIVFFPAALLEDLVLNSEFVQLTDAFGHQRLREGEYTPGQIDSQWSDEIKKDFLR